MTNRTPRSPPSDRRPLRWPEAALLALLLATLMAAAFFLLAELCSMAVAPHNVDPWTLCRRLAGV